MTWLFIPSHCVPELGCSTKDCAPDASFSASNKEPFVTLKWKPLQPQRLLAAWRKNAWMRRLSGLTLSPSTAERGAAAWIASLPVSHANPIASPVAAKAPRTTGGCGATSAESSATFLLGSFFSKTSGDCFPVEGSRKSSDRWAPSGSILNGEYWPRPKLAPVTSGGGFSFWPTATVCGNHNRKGASLNSGDGLATASSQWMTPMVPNGGRVVSADLVASKSMTDSGQKRTVGLESQARHWPTPMASDDGQKVTENSSQSGLIGASLRFSRPDLILPTGNGDSRHRLGSRPRLNPAFVCWLMGWPWWWMNPGQISFAAAEMALFRFRLQQHLSCLLDEPELCEEAA